MHTLLVLAKQPIPGRVKTRLARTIGGYRAAQLYQAFVADVAEACRAVTADRVAWWVEGDPNGFGVSLEGFDVFPQPEGDLGTRLGTAFDEAFTAPGKVAVVGTDCPTLGTQELEALFQNIGGPEHAVILPAKDGGYAGLALGRRCPKAFLDIPWSTPQVLAATRTALEAQGCKVTLLPPVRDVDDADDLDALALLLDETPKRAPHTARVLLARPETPTWGTP